MPLGDVEHPISFLFQPKVEQGEHVVIEVRAGLRPHRAITGELIMRAEEWAVLRELMRRARSAPATSELVDLHLDADPLEIGDWR